MARQMKDSGVEWIGEIPEEWNIVQSRRYVSVNHGADPKTQGDIPVYGSGSISFKTCGEYKEGPTVLLGRKGTLNAPQYITGKYWNVDTAFDVAVTDDIALRFYYYLATCFDYMYYSSQTAVPSMTQSNYLSMRLPIPFINVQNCIVKLLDAKCAEIYKIIERTRATIEEYKKLKQAIITEAVTKGVRSPRPMKPSGVEWIGDIPEEWVVKRIKYVLNNHDALRRPIAAENRSQKGDILYDYYGASGVIDQIDDYIIEGTYILIGEDGANLVLRNLPLVYVAKGKYWVNNHAHILSPKQGIEFNYIIHALESADYTTFITGTAQPKLSQGNLSQVSLPVPTTEEQQEIAAYLDAKCAEIDRIIQKKEQLIEELGSYKKSLIYEYVTGKKEVTA